MTNAAKHAFPGERAGRVELRFRREGESLALAVADDGVGAPAAAAGGGQGHRLVREFARQLEGELEVAPAGGGTCATVRFPARRALPDGRANGRRG